MSATRKHRQGRITKPHVYKTNGGWFIDGGFYCSGPHTWAQLPLLRGTWSWPGHRVP